MWGSEVFTAPVRSYRKPLGLKALLAGALLLIGGTPIAAQGLGVQLLGDRGLNSNSLPLLPFFQPDLGRWMQENADLVTGVQPSGVAPIEGDGMLAMMRSGASVSQVRQRIDVSSLAGQIDAGNIRAYAFGQLNASVAGTTGGIQVLALDAAQNFIVATGGGDAFDGDVTTWEPVAASLSLPAGTRFVEYQFHFTNANLPLGEVGYGDDARLLLGDEVLSAPANLNALTMMEALATGVSRMQEDLGLDPTSTFSWTGDFDDAGWSGSVSGTLYGQPFSLNYQGNAVLQGSGDYLIGFSASGLRGSDPITITGSASWAFAPNRNMFVSMAYEEVGIIEDAGGGPARLRWWHRAAEYLGGTLAGAFTGGGLFTGFFQFAALSISDHFANRRVDGSEPPPPPFPPIADQLAFSTTQNLLPTASQVLATVSGDGTLSANFSNTVRLTGSWAGGTASGTGVVIPPPLQVPALPLPILLSLGFSVLILGVYVLRLRRPTVVSDK